MDEMAKEIENALKQDLNAKLKHAPHGLPGGVPMPPKEPTLSQQIESMVAGLQARIRVLEALRATL